MAKIHKKEGRALQYLYGVKKRTKLATPSNEKQPFIIARFCSLPAIVASLEDLHTLASQHRKNADRYKLKSSAFCC